MAYIKKQIFVLIEEGIVHADMIKPPPNCWCNCFIPTTFPKERREMQLWQCLMKRFPHFRTSGLLTILQISDGLFCTSHQLGFRLAVRRSIPEPLVWKVCPEDWAIALIPFQPEGAQTAIPEIEPSLLDCRFKLFFCFLQHQESFVL